MSIHYYLVAHKTTSVFDGYNIVSAANLADAARKIEAGRSCRAEFGQDLAKEHQEQGNQQEHKMTQVVITVYLP